MAEYQTKVDGNVTNAMIKFVGKRTKNYPVAIRIAIVPTASKDRSVKENFIIWNKLKKDRNPVFNRPADKQKIKSIIQNRMQNESDLLRAAHEVGKYMIETIRRHVFEEQSAAGPMRPLTKRVAALKAKVYPGQPILVRTGQLIDSLKVKIRVNK